MPEKDEQEHGWRELLEAGKYWQVVGITSLPESELREMIAILESVVPQRQFGDGMETYTDFIRPEEATSSEIAGAARLLEGAQSWLHNRSDRHIVSAEELFAKPIAKAVSVLRDLGVEGLPDPRQFGRHAPKAASKHATEAKEEEQRFFEQISEARLERLQVGKATISRNVLVTLDENSPPEGIKPSDIEDARAAVVRRKSQTDTKQYYQLTVDFALGEIDPFSPLWHSFNILYQVDSYFNQLSVLFDPGSQRPSEALIQQVELNALSKCSLEIGASFSSLMTKEAEYVAVSKGKDDAKRGRLGGAKSSSNKAKRIGSFVGQIEALGHLFPQISEERLVGQAFENAVAQNPELWTQGSGQRDNYLIIIRSEDPYKSRYDAVFRKTA